MIKFKSLNKSKDFLKILKKKKINNKYFTIYFDKTSTNHKNSLDKYCLLHNVRWSHHTVL